MNRFEKVSIFVFVAVAAIILYVLWEKSHSVVTINNDQTPYNYFNGIPQMTITGIPTLAMPESNASSPTINITNGDSHLGGSHGCSCGGCGGCSSGAGSDSSLTTLANYLNSIGPKYAAQYADNVNTMTNGVLGMVYTG